MISLFYYSDDRMKKATHVDNAFHIQIKSAKHAKSTQNGIFFKFTGNRIKKCTLKT